MIKAAFFDIDGTLISHKQGAVPEDTRMALELLHRKGILVFTSTGRHILELDQLPMEGIYFDGYVLLNGQLCLDSQRNTLSDFPIDPEDIRQALKLFRKRKLPMAFVEKERIYVNFIDERLKKAQEAISSPLPELGEYQGAKVYLVNVFSGDEDVYAVIEHLPHCKQTRWSDYGVDIIAESSGKVPGIEKMMESFGLKREEIIAFGDGENDMEMLEFAGIGVAMGNASDEVKACADYVTRDVDDGGILAALQHYGIL